MRTRDFVRIGRISYLLIGGMLGARTSGGGDGARGIGPTSPNTGDVDGGGPVRVWNRRAGRIACPHEGRRGCPEPRGERRVANGRCENQEGLP